jgi:hypothetical protein
MNWGSRNQQLGPPDRPPSNTAAASVIIDHSSPAHFGRSAQGRGGAVGRGLAGGLCLGVGVGRGVALGSGGVGVAVGVTVAVGVGVTLPAGPCTATVSGEPVLKKPTVPLPACGG